MSRGSYAAPWEPDGTSATAPTPSRWPSAATPLLYHAPRNGNHDQQAHPSSLGNGTSPRTSRTSSSTELLRRTGRHPCRPVHRARPTRSLIPRSRSCRCNDVISCGWALPERPPWAAASVFGPWQANADTVGPLRAAPTTPFAVGVRQFNWTRGNRQIPTFVYYPASGPAGGGPITNAPLAAGVFPVCVYQHGLTGTPQGSLGVIRPLAAAGFIVPAASLPKVGLGDTYNGEPAPGQLRNHHPDAGPEHQQRPVGRPHRHNRRRRHVRPLHGRHDHPRDAHRLPRLPDQGSGPHVLHRHG